MGTSASSSGPNNSSPLIPPWAEESDPLELIPSDGGGVPESEEGGDSSDESLEIDNGSVQDLIPGPKIQTLPGKRLAGARRAFGDYAKSGGGSNDLRRALKKYSTSSKGGGSSMARKLAGGITAGTALFSLVSGDSVKAQNRTLNLSDLSGLSIDQAIDRISEHLCPDASDSDQIRIAIDYALTEALEDQEEFDEGMFNPDLVGDVVANYLTDLVFQEVLNDMGEAWLHAETHLKQLDMETELRELVKVVTETQLHDITGGNYSVMTRDTITKIQIDVIAKTIEEWESY
ncbi:hypothetical protein VITU102760_19790 [Vibrio tubiashii]|uniref:Uncharacterized protein n=1 Tax=Vibrio tubiashii ATCC 19109 TaxID=1051646 RepID=F9T2Y1_9VIBR|nr:hypothetical protein [Vibrio tubiashii]AIW17252.1 hypothetical protein IX91_24560 [Vibrio tubiashii ATCC 19109]EGU57352.1 hypothetical protein VITU9109_00460 [Vibrio tubiashii ATCC 19109]EIF04984.1 hypothetical protein VT1337_05739 [Vibrio tubiashii NCIMB 1337 = ATCC 19106]